MKNQILEEVKRYRELFNYNTKLTLSENLEIINEIKVGATIVKDLETISGKNILAFMSDLRIGTTSAEEIGKLLAMDANNFERAFNKSLSKDFANGTKGRLGDLSKELSKIEILRNIAAETKVKGSALTKAETDVIIQRVKSTNDLKAAKFVPKLPKKKTPVDADDMAKAEREFQKVTDPNKTSWNWNKWKKWALLTGITTAALYALYRVTKKEEPPVIDDDDDNIVPTVTPVPQPITTKYTSCPETFPISQNCKNSKIKEVQACLNMPAKYQTGNFGTITQGYLERAGVSGTEITQDSYDKVCEGKTTNDWTDAETEDIASANTSGSAGGTTTGGGETSSSDDMS